MQRYLMRNGSDPERLEIFSPAQVRTRSLFRAVTD
jgi:hypothetical protein